MTDHPDKPVFVFAVGITGHRLNKLPPEQIGRVERALAATFAEIDAACAAEKARSKDTYAAAPNRVRLVSGMAEGTDQIAVACRPQHWEVDAVLPFPRARYAADFAPENASGGIDRRRELDVALAAATTIVELPGEGDPPDAYEAAGEFVLGQSDVLVAVWDGKPKAGTGGSEAIVTLAVEADIPVIWIHSERDEAPMLIRAAAYGERRMIPTPATSAAIANVVREASALDAGDHASVDHGHAGPAAGAKRRFTDFLAETWRSKCRWVAFDLLDRLRRPRSWRFAIPLRSREDYGAAWQKFAADASTDAGFAQRVVGVLAMRHAWADGLATYFAHAYRSTYVLTYGLSVVAVVVALLEVLPFAPSEADVQASLAFKAVLAAVGLAAVATIIFLVRRGRKLRLHERWLDYRMLAERLRHLRFLGLVGEGGVLLRLASRSKQGPDWVLWYLRATCREIGTAGGLFDEHYRKQVLRTVKRYEIDEQLAYHRANTARLSELDHRLHILGNRCFFLSAFFLALFLAAYFLLPGVSPLLPGYGTETAAIHVLEAAKPVFTFLDTFLPALGAALAGIRFTGDFEGSVKRSAETAAALESLKETYGMLVRQPRLGDTSKVLVATAAVLAEDVGGWQSLYSRKKLALPG